MIKFVILAACLCSLSVAQINFPSCNQTYTACLGQPACADLFSQNSYTACTGSNGCMDFGLNYANIVSEYFCEDNCLNTITSGNNDNFVNFESCVSNLITPDYCGVSLTACQANTGTNNCAPLINQKTIADCINGSSACQITTPSAASLYACYSACFNTVNSTNALWNNLSSCIVGLGSVCYSAEQDCVADQLNCGSALPAVEQCVLKACPTLFNSITVNAETLANCYLPCFTSNAPPAPSAAWTTLVSCVQNTVSPSPSPSPSPSSNSSDSSNSSESSGSSGDIPSNSSSSSNSSNSSGVTPVPSTGSSSTYIGFAFFVVAFIYAAISF